MNKSYKIIFANEDTEVQKIDRHEYPQFFEDNPEMVIKIIETEVKMLRRLSEQYSDACKTIAAYVDESVDQKRNDRKLMHNIEELININKAIMDYKDQK